MLFAATVLGGCNTNGPANTALLRQGEPAIMREVMARKDRIIFLQARGIQKEKPSLLLIAGATDDPTEMLDIFEEWQDKYNVFLYSYNYHQSVEKVGRDLTREMTLLRARLEGLDPRNCAAEKLTVITYSYSAIVFRSAVISADDPALFSKVSLIQLVPTAGGSHLAKLLKFPPFAWAVALASKPSVAENPYGPLARRLWDGEGNRRFYEAISPARMQAFVLEGDRHSLAGVRNQGVRTRYENGIGTNIILIPKGEVSHEYFPQEAKGLGYIGKLLEAKAVEAGAAEARVKADENAKVSVTVNENKDAQSSARAARKEF